MEGILEHFVHMVLCKCAVVLIKAESMKPSFSDAVWQGKKMLKQWFLKGILFQIKKFSRNPQTTTTKKKNHPKPKLTQIGRYLFSTIPQSLVLPIDCIDDSMFKKNNPLKQIQHVKKKLLFSFHSLLT